MKDEILVLAIALSCMFTCLQAHPGSLYSLKQSPYTTYIAQRAGDILTVIVEESASTINDGKTISERRNAQELSLNKLFFPHFKISTGLDDTNGSGDPLGMAWNTNNRLEGLGKNDSTHRMATVMQVRIIEEVRDGTYFIKGFRNLNIDGKDKKLYVSGVIRQRDIAPDNTILSSRIADAVIEIEGEMGKGVLKSGLMHRLFNFIF